MPTIEVVADNKAAQTHTRFGLNLFWRTFIMIGMLLTTSAIGWVMTLRSLDLEPRARQAAQQIASLVNLSRAALIYSDSISRYALIKTLDEEEGVRIFPRESTDIIVPVQRSRLADRVMQELRLRLGAQTIVASKVNGESGVWIGFDIGRDAYWLLTSESRFSRVDGATWLLWALITSLLSLAGAAAMAGVVNLPLKQLLAAIEKVHQGDFKAGQLDEAVSTKEIREVNIGFNRMAEEMAKVEQNRTVMLAGLSHDLRTPLARLRLEVELSVADGEAQKHMAADIEQLDGIINKFIEYASPDSMTPAKVQLAEVVQRCVYPYLNAGDMAIHVDVSPSLGVCADEVDLARVISNLLENARRYGKSADTHITELCISAQAKGSMVHLQIYDKGSGVPPAILAQLTQPFFRADEARTSAVGSGLGLAIVKKIVEHTGGTLVFNNRLQGGLVVDINLPRAK